MYLTQPNDPIDYLVIGHLAIDLSEDGPRLGGTAAYAALTAKALGLRVGIITSWAEEVTSDLFHDIPIINYPTQKSTTFENIYTPEGRVQFVHHVADNLDFFMVPEIWRNAPIVHLGPLVQEVAPDLVRHFPTSLICLTPQGWLREWDQEGRVTLCEWPEAAFTLEQSGAAVISIEDIGQDEKRIEELAASCQILAVTENSKGVRLYWHGDVRRFPAPLTSEKDSTGAGDIFAAAFFTRLYTTRDPWEAARFANQLASYSVKRIGLNSVPTPTEIEECMVEVY
jgi:sugar/nucleoside kinase (ribokinase family)